MSYVASADGRMIVLLAARLRRRAQAPPFLRLQLFPMLGVTLVLSNILKTHPPVPFHTLPRGFCFFRQAVHRFMDRRERGRPLRGRPSLRRVLFLQLRGCEASINHVALSTIIVANRSLGVRDNLW